MEFSKELRAKWRQILRDHQRERKTTRRGSASNPEQLPIDFEAIYDHDAAIFYGQRANGTHVQFSLSDRRWNGQPMIKYSPRR